MNMFLTLAYLFFIGSTLGWVAELLYRRFLSGANPERKWKSLLLQMTRTTVIYSILSAASIFILFTVCRDSKHKNTTKPKFNKRVKGSAKFIR